MHSDILRNDREETLGDNVKRSRLPVILPSDQTGSSNAQTNKLLTFRMDWQDAGMVRILLEISCWDMEAAISVMYIFISVSSKDSVILLTPADLSLPRYGLNFLFFFAFSCAQERQTLKKMCLEGKRKSETINKDGFWTAVFLLLSLLLILPKPVKQIIVIWGYINSVIQV